VLIASEGEQAVHLVEQQPVDVVLLDLRMPGLSGIQVLEKIKAINPAIEVIVVTGYASYETVLEGLRLHAFDYIPKPFSISHLRDVVKRAAAQRQGGEQQGAALAAQQLRELLRNLGVVSDSLRQSLQILGQVSQSLQRDYANLLTPPREALC